MVGEDYKIKNNKMLTRAMKKCVVIGKTSLLHLHGGREFCCVLYCRQHAKICKCIKLTAVWCSQYYRVSHSVHEF